jgi:catechol 2,3-dioxygenase
MAPATLPPDTRIGAVRLRVRDLPAAVRFYRDVLGFNVAAADGGSASLGTEGGSPLLTLLSRPDAPARPDGSTGLFHVAFLLPGRDDLGAMIRRVDNGGIAFDGFADHHVSEAAYLRDPEGNGLELYADRPREGWQGPGGRTMLTTEPLDVHDLLRGTPEPAAALPAGTVVGHVHLRVSTLEAAEAFYVHRLGFDVVTRDYPGALFVSAGGYHHHVGLNVWGGVGASRPPGDSPGLDSFDLVVPSEEARHRLIGKTGEGDLFDLDDHRIRVVRGEEAPRRP